MIQIYGFAVKKWQFQALNLSDFHYIEFV